MLVPLEMLLFGRNPPAGMNPFRVMALADYFRSTAEPCDPPIQVTAEGEYWRVHDGRHRAVGALFAGRSHIDATIIQEA